MIDDRPHGNTYARWGLASSALREPMVKWARKQSSPPCTYRVVAHVVRHPLKVLSSSVAFGQCVECWVHVEDFVLPPFAAASSSSSRAATKPMPGDDEAPSGGGGPSFSKPPNGTTLMSTMSQSPQRRPPPRAVVDLSSRARAAVVANRRAKRNDKMGGREWPAAAVDALLEGFALYWLAWNAMIEPVADHRFRVEHADYALLCRLAGVDAAACETAAAAAQQSSHKFVTGNHGGAALRITWPRLARIHAELADEVWRLAQRYGYDRDPPARRGGPTASSTPPGGNAIAAAAAESSSSSDSLVSTSSSLSPAEPIAESGSRRRSSPPSDGP